MLTNTHELVHTSPNSNRTNFQVESAVGAKSMPWKHIIVCKGENPLREKYLDRIRSYKQRVN